MKNLGLSIVAMACALIAAGPGHSGERTVLSADWTLQSSVKVAEGGEALSSLGCDVRGWYPVTVPVTVLAALVENNVYPDPFFGLNLKSIPGYVDGRWLVMPEDSPFYPSWWYRTEFSLPPDYRDKHLTLVFEGINYKANVWLNGRLVADSREVVGMFRRFEFEVTGLANPGRDNCLAVEIIAPGKLPKKKYLTKQVEAATGWDDHNPQPPDLNMGIWQNVYVAATGPVDLEYPYVSTDLDLPALDHARLAVSVHAVNPGREKVTGELSGRIGDITFSKTVELGPGEEKLVKFSPDEYKQLNVQDPRLWWPHPTGPQNLYQLDLAFTIGGKNSDQESTTFGIREVTTYINDEGWRAYRINGKNILIRGGAWMTTDMLLRFSERRYAALVRYAREANLNMLRSEGFSIRETDEFHDLCDRSGVMVTQQIFGRSIPDEELARACARDMLLRIRNHPSLVHFLGHDETFPTETLDAAYRQMIAELTPERTYQPHSGAFQVKDRFQTGGTRTGTLELWTWAGPAQYYTHKIDGAWGFAQSGGIGGVAAPLESIKRMMPASELWPPLHTEAWSFHTVIQGGTYFNKLVKAMNKRYGETGNIEDFVMTAHVMNYESARGMYEAYARNKYSATGITTWKYDAAWPAAMTWQYVDWHLLPTGAYYGAKKACEPIHVQYSYDDDSVWVVNSLYQSVKGLEVEAQVYDFNLQKRWSKSAAVDVGEDGKTEAFTAKFPKDLTRSYFLRLTLRGQAGKLITENFYWLSTRPDRPGKKFYGMVPLTPTSQPDHTMLRELPRVKLDASCKLGSEGDKRVVTVSLKNPSPNLAFFVQLAVTKGRGGMEVAPSYWSENDFALLPGEEKTLEVNFDDDDLEGKKPTVRIGGWNIEPGQCEP